MGVLFGLSLRFRALYIKSMLCARSCLFRMGPQGCSSATYTKNIIALYRAAFDSALHPLRAVTRPQEVPCEASSPEHRSLLEGSWWRKHVVAGASWRDFCLASSFLKRRAIGTLRGSCMKRRISYNLWFVLCRSRQSSIPGNGSEPRCSDRRPRSSEALRLLRSAGFGLGFALLEITASENEGRRCEMPPGDQGTFLLPVTSQVFINSESGQLLTWKGFKNDEKKNHSGFFWFAPWYVILHNGPWSRFKAFLFD